MTGTVAHIFVADAGGAGMDELMQVRALEGAGLDGDRYATGRGYWSGVDECEVTLIEAEALELITAEHGVGVLNGEHRRNIVTRGVDLLALAGKRFWVGEAIFVFDRPRPPCRYVASLTEPGMTRALGGRRGGVCARVVRSGLVRVGDAVAVIDHGDGPP